MSQEIKLTTAQRLAQRKPLEVYKSADGSWTWEVYKHYQKPEKERQNPYARVFCRVITPIVPEGELGDVYLRDIQGARVA